MEEISSFFLQIRTSANSFLSQYEPLTLLLTPLLLLFLTSNLQSFFNFVQEKGIRAALIGFFMSSIKLIPGVNNRIEAEKQKVVEKLQSGSKSKREGWMTELPKAGLGGGVIEKLRDEKMNDVVWQGKCSVILVEMNQKGIFL